MYTYHHLLPPLMLLPCMAYCYSRTGTDRQTIPADRQDRRQTTGDLPHQPRQSPRRVASPTQAYSLHCSEKLENSSQAEPTPTKAGSGTDRWVVKILNRRPVPQAGRAGHDNGAIKLKDDPQFGMPACRPSPYAAFYAAFFCLCCCSLSAMCLPPQTFWGRATGKTGHGQFRTQTDRRGWANLTDRQNQAKPSYHPLHSRHICMLFW